MSKKIKMVLVLVVMLGLAGSAQAEVHYFWGNASGDWAATSGVWNDHPVCCTVPSPTSLDQDIAISIGNVTIDVTTAGQGAIDLMGGYHTGTSTINVAAGIYWQITHSGQIGCGNDADTDIATGILNVYGSAYFEQLKAGNSKYDTGIVNVYAGGSLVVGAWGCTVGFAGADATGTINLNQSGSMTINSGLTMNPKGHIDIESGTLKVLGDYVTQLQGYIDNGWITGYDGDGTVFVTSNSGYSTVAAVTYSSRATDPIPNDEEGGIEPNATLSWTKGYLAADVNGHDVYLGTDYNSVTDANHSYGEFKGRQTAASYDPPGSLESGQTYYWRIDEVNGVNVWKGHVWSFYVGEVKVRITNQDEQFLDVSLYCPKFVFNTNSTSENIKPTSVDGNLALGEVMIVDYNSITLSDSLSLQPQLRLQWSSNEGILRKWVRYQLMGTPGSIVLKEIVLEKMDKSFLSAEPFINSPQSYPAFANGFFMGIEFPIASTRIEGLNLIMGHKPGLRPLAGVWYESRRAIYGTATIGKERKAFEDYITLHRPQPTGLHINYNSWWTSPYPTYTETNILALMQQFKDNMTTPYGVSLDTFTIDDGWANNQSIWEIKTSSFPNGFTNIQNYAQGMGANLGLWSSPSAMYPNSLDTTWAMQHGYETYKLPWVSYRFCCMAGPNYISAYANKLVNYANLYDVKQYKMDGFDFNCNESSHGHEPNELATEAMAQGGIDVFQAIHADSPQAWIEATCFSWGKVGSPWWLFYVNSITGAFGDDAPAGKIPCPVYRESYTTARDYYNLQGASLSPVPIAGQEVLGIVHQTTEPFLNDGVITVMRGHAFLSLYVNPAYMSGRWSALAQLLTWARNNSGTILANTYPLLPASWLNGNQPKFSSSSVMPREIYGYAHCLNNQGLIVLRNPWIMPQTYTLTLNDSIGFNSQAAGLSAVSLYPENRVYGQNLNYGSTFTLPIAPYETVVLSIGSGYDINGIPTVGGSIGGRLQTNAAGSCLMGGLPINLQATVDSNAPQTKLLVCMEGTSALANPTYQLLVNGSPATVTTISSEDGWCATGLPLWEHWKFLQVNLTSAHSVISLQQLQPGSNCTNVSIWAWATKNGSGTPSFSNSLPSPELISLDAVLLGVFNREPSSSEDINNDCYVNFADFAIIAGSWLDCTEPTDANCL